jgi:hypothetical protein
MRTVIYHHLHLSGDDGMDEQQSDWCCGWWLVGLAQKLGKQNSIFLLAPLPKSCFSKTGIWAVSRHESHHLPSSASIRRWWNGWAANWLVLWLMICRILAQKLGKHKHSQGCHFLGSGFWELFWISQNPHFWRANFPEPSWISQNPKKNLRVCASAEDNTRCCVAHEYNKQHNYLRRVVSLVLRRSSYAKNTTTLCCHRCGIDGPRLVRSNFKF